MYHNRSFVFVYPENMNINSFKMQMDKLNVGMHVEIMRSNGRIHGAIVTELKPTTKSVSVEWFEKGETKGKEIDISALIKSNPLIFQSDPAIDVVVAAHPDVHTSRSRHTISSVDTATNNNSKGAKPNIQQLTNAPKKAGSAKQEEKTNNKRNVQTTGNRKTSHEPAAKSNRQKVADKRLTSVVENHLGEEVLDTLEPANNDQKMMQLDQPTMDQSQQMQTRMAIKRKIWLPLEENEDEKCQQFGGFSSKLRFLGEEDESSEHKKAKNSNADFNNDTNFNVWPLNTGEMIQTLGYTALVGGILELVGLPSVLASLMA